MNIDEELAEKIAGCEWVASGLTGKDWLRREWLPLSFVRDLANADVSTARMLFGYPWMADDLTLLEYRTIIWLLQIAQEDPEFARLVASQPFMDPPFRDRDSFALEAMGLMVGEAPSMNVIALLKEQPWFSDGLDDDEASLLAVMRSELYISREFRKALIESHTVESKSVRLPLADDAEFIVITHGQSLNYGEIFTAMEVAIRSYETLLGLRFPFKDVILLVSNPTIWDPRGEGNILGSNTARYVRSDYPVLIRTIYHELGHFYLYGGESRWIPEGAADFLATYAEIQVGATSIEHRLKLLDERVASNCKETIQEQLIDWRRSGCDYFLGERFLWHLYLALGEETVAASLRDLALAQREGLITEEDFYNIFVENTAFEKLNDFQRVYDEFHGGRSVGRFQTRRPHLVIAMSFSTRNLTGRA